MEATDIKGKIWKIKWKRKIGKYITEKKGGPVKVTLKMEYSRLAAIETGLS